MASRNGVYYDLSKSPLCATHLGITFAFSSELHRQRFERLAVQRMEWLTDSMSRRIGVRMEMHEPALIQLYRQTETRGFLIEIDGETFTCLDELVFSGHLRRSDGSTPQ